MSVNNPLRLIKLIEILDADNFIIFNSPDPIAAQDVVNLRSLNAAIAASVLQYNAEAVAETSTTSEVVESTKVTLTTPALPLGDYLLEWSFKRRANGGNKRMVINVRDGAALLVSQDEHFADATQDAALTMRKKLTGISGIKTYTLNFRADTNNTTVYMSEALVTLRRLP